MNNNIQYEGQKKIGLLLGSLSGAGAEKTILTLAKGLARRGVVVDLYVLGLRKADYVVPAEVNVILLKGGNSFLKKIHLLVSTYSKKYSLFVTSRAEYYSFIHANKKICSVHITPTAWLSISDKKYIQKLKRLKAKFVGKELIALSQGIKDDLVNNLGCQSGAVTVINNPYRFEEIEEKASVQKDLPDFEYIIYVASFIPRKRHIDLLKAFSMIENKSIKLLLLGKGELFDDIANVANRLGIGDRVVFWGWDANPYRLIKHAKLSLLCSEAEGLPRALVESLIIGTPVVSTDCPSGPNEVLVGEFSGYLVPVGDVERLAEGIDAALVYYPSINNLDLSRFTVDSVVEKYMALL